MVTVASLCHDFCLEPCKKAQGFLLILEPKVGFNVGKFQGKFDRPYSLMIQHLYRHDMLLSAKKQYLTRKSSLVLLNST